MHIIQVFFMRSDFHKIENTSILSTFAKKSKKIAKKIKKI